MKWTKKSFWIINIVVLIPGTSIKITQTIQKGIAVMCSREGASCSIMRGALHMRYQLEV